MRQRLVEKIEQLRKWLEQHEEALKILDSLGEADVPKARPKRTKPSKPQARHFALPEGMTRAELKNRILRTLEIEPMTSTDIIEKWELQKSRDGVYSALYDLKKEKLIIRNSDRMYSLTLLGKGEIK